MNKVNHNTVSCLLCGFNSSEPLAYFLLVHTLYLFNYITQRNVEGPLIFHIFAEYSAFCFISFPKDTFPSRRLQWNNYKAMTTESWCCTINILLKYQVIINESETWKECSKIYHSRIICSYNKDREAIISSVLLPNYVLS